MATFDGCFHCALPIPANCDFTVDIEGASQPVCCPGCKAVAELIRDAGLSRYYTLRETPTPGLGRPEAAADEWQVFDREDMLEAFAERQGDQAQASIFAGGMYCAACSWLIETTLGKTPGVLSAEVNPVTHRVLVTWRPDEIGLGGILGVLSGLGYKPQPLAPDADVRPELVEQRSALKRLLVASIGMMQVMMFAVGLYSGQFQGIDEDMQRFLRFISLFVTTPVVFYSARPFFAGAIRGVRARRPGMDLPVSIAIGGAYVASVYSTFVDGAEVWFDSVTMFVFFLTLGRFLEMRARHRSIDRSAALSSAMPNTVTRIDADEHRVVPASQLVAGDRVRIRPGEAIPADGVIESGTTTIDESVLTGESQPQLKRAGDAVVAGSVNLDGVIEMLVRQTGVDTTLGTIGRLSERARYARPAFVQLADKVASYFVVAILVLAASVATAWYLIDAERAFVVTLSVLVVTCPCALALATPAAFAAAGSRLSELHLLITNGNAVEALARATHVVFDKTGTLTRGMPSVLRVALFDKGLDETRARDIAAALETASTHPIARAFSTPSATLAVSAPKVVVGEGVEGVVEGQHWRLGSLAFVAADATEDTAVDDGATQVFLGTDGRVAARFDIGDELRPDARSALKELETIGLNLVLLSGDRETAVKRVATTLAIREARARCSPQDKLKAIHALQSSGATVVMVGDGINDAPVLAGADASIAPSHAALLAQTSADILMLGESLQPLVTAFRATRQTMRIVRQNIVWAVGYNVSALPLAAAGLVPPWAAAIGMSASSLIVVLNALRLSRFDAHPRKHGASTAGTVTSKPGRGRESLVR